MADADGGGEEMGSGEETLAGVTGDDATPAAKLTLGSTAAGVVGGACCCSGTKGGGPANADDRGGGEGS